jgi:tetratricopeptide (TPR) repeat protein
MIASALAQVRLLYQQQNFDDALVVLGRYAAHNDLTVEMLLLKGRLIQLSESGKYDLSEAKQCFLKALEQDVESIKVMLELGWLLLNVLEEPAEARQYFNRALAVIDAAQKEARAGLDNCENLNLH